jgi:FMN phosphatase YigB (HAD superfamily)
VIRPAAVFFDIGDTLVHRPRVGPGRRLAGALGLGGDEARTITRMLFREPFASPAALVARLGAEFGLPASIRATVEDVWAAQESEPVELDGATACVAAVRDAGARVGVISNIWAPYETGFRRACPAIVPLVESWHLSYRLGAAKPDAAVFRAALRDVGVEPTAAVMVGDSVDKDIVPAVALGMRAVWIPHVPDDEDPGANAGDLGGRPAAADAVRASLPAGAIRAGDLHAARAALVAMLGTDERIGVDRRP